MRGCIAASGCGDRADTSPVSGADPTSASNQGEILAPNPRRGTARPNYEAGPARHLTQTRKAAAVGRKRGSLQGATAPACLEIAKNGPT